GFRATFDQFFHGKLGSIAGARNCADFSFDRFVARFKHFLREINCAVTGGFRSHKRPAPIRILTGQHARELVSEPFVLAKEISNLTTTNADVTRRHVRIGTDVAKKFGHERLAKTHDLNVGFPFWIKIGAALAPAHWQTRKRIFENLFKRQELDDARSDRRVKTQSSFVRAERAVHLHTETAVHLDLALVVSPWDTEMNHPLRLHQALENLSISIFLVALDDRANRFKHFSHRLKKLRLIWITLLYNFENLLHQTHKGVTSAGYWPCRQ